MSASQLGTSKKRTWSEVNRSRKEEKRKWREINLEKKLEKQKQKAKTKENQLLENQEHSKSVKPFSTLSIAVPGSILENAQSAELRAYLAGQIARAACIFQADEVIVFDDYAEEVGVKKAKFDDGKGEQLARHSCVQLGRILQYLECPQYLRKSFFPIHKDLQYCGVLNPLNAPHHLGPKDGFIYREGVVLNTPVKAEKGSVVNVGLLKLVRVDKVLVPGIRCTVKLLPQDSNNKKLKGVVVSPLLPRSDTGIYWGYSVRIANSLSKVFSQCPYKEGYDISIGTSDKGASVDNFECPKYKHLLVMFGGLQGLEAALENDNVLDADDPSLLFDYYLNTLPQQGSKTIRTEEAILVSLAALRPKLNPEYKLPIFDGSSEEFSENSNKPDVENTRKESISAEATQDKADDMSRFDSD
ncbi:28S rRNA (uridine-N(3))-methyltransferase [Rhynchophorus ferrugineus]|uniref:28S rRNA (uridine-N(3))-methyltransferase n=1 Tax=Rhynchophorus ferrugineus TaxID=354439 RepID=UPI003FCDDC20